jgi:GT2 family glycosyltransferase
MRPLVVIVIVVWNGIEDTLECLRSLSQDLYPNKEVLVVDNGSTDGSAERIRDEGFGAAVLRCQLNLGFTGGNNVGLAEARRRGAKYAFLLNNDTIVEPDAISLLVAAAEARSGAALLSPVVYYYDTPETVWFSGATLSLPRGEALHQDIVGGGERVPPLGSEGGTPDAYPCPWVSGCAMLVNLRAVALVGGFDDRFFLTWEDVDWCIRMRDADWSVVVVPGARIYHKCGRSGARLTGIHRYYAVRNSLLLAAKHAGPFYFTALLFVLGRHLRSALRSGQADQGKGLFTIFEGLKDHWLGRYGRRPSTRTSGPGKGSGGSVESAKIKENACASSK